MQVGPESRIFLRMAEARHSSLYKWTRAGPPTVLRNQETNTGRDEASADLYSRVTDVHEHEDAHNGAHDSGNETHYWIASFPPG